LSPGLENYDISMSVSEKNILGESDATAEYYVGGAPEMIETSFVTVFDSFGAV